MERSLVLIKPDAMERGLGGVIIGRLQQRGLKLFALKMLRMDRALAERHYDVHRGKPFFDDVVAYIISTPIIAGVFGGDNAIDEIRSVMGATDPWMAKAGTIRAEFGVDIQRNATHASDSPENGLREIALYFTEDEIFSY